MSNNNLDDLTKALSAVLVQRGDLQAEVAKMRADSRLLAGMYEQALFEILDLRSELAALQELYADRDRDLAFEYARANTAEAAADRLCADIDELHAEILRLRQPCLCCRAGDCLDGCRCHPQHGAPLVVDAADLPF